MKLPFSFSIKFIFRFLFPGLIVALAIFPALRALSDRLCTNIQTEYIITISSIVIGWLFTVMDMHIYMALEGRRYWPQWLRNVFQRWEERRLKKYLEKYSKAKEADRIKYIEISVELRRFPLNNAGEPTATYPTRLGNLIASYEEYPLRVYGMDSIFYWYRIWMAVDEDLREHIDNQQALADSAVYMTVALFIAGLVLSGYAVLQKMQFILSSGLPDASILLFMGIIAIGFSKLVYSASLHLHASFGEIYKSFFDIHKNKVPLDDVIEFISKLTKNNTMMDSSTFEKYKIAWRYMHNYKIKTKDGVVSAATFFSED
jgi:hypothetical protein